MFSLDNDSTETPHAIPAEAISWVDVRDFGTGEVAERAALLAFCRAAGRFAVPIKLAGLVDRLWCELSEDLVHEANTSAAVDAEGPVELIEVLETTFDDGGKVISPTAEGGHFERNFTFGSGQTCVRLLERVEPGEDGAYAYAVGVGYRPSQTKGFDSLEKTMECISQQIDARDEDKDIEVAVPDEVDEPCTLNRHVTH
jgi:hypothetical protein